MMDERSHATRLARAFGLFTLLAGIAIMHALVIGTGHAATPDHAGSASHSAVHGTTADHTLSPDRLGPADQPHAASPAGADAPPHAQLAHPVGADAAHHPQLAHPTGTDVSRPSNSTAGLFHAQGTAPAIDVPDCGGDCGSGHAGLHGCVFVLTALLLGLGLALLAWVGLTRPGGIRETPRQARAQHARPPPWTVPTLADLAILRI
ncbi:hypothetical protein [Nocardia sp. NPDC057668]|uniref:hypothetical protein n=1 Tax=Nocardia sp. NPDC057668 TaxID=3346202 RepID=UPI00367070BB